MPPFEMSQTFVWTHFTHIVFTNPVFQCNFLQIQFSNVTFMPSGKVIILGHQTMNVGWWGVMSPKLLVSAYQQNGCGGENL